MPKVWVLDTETKGTGATVAPLRDAPRPAPEPLYVPPEQAPRPAPAPAPRAPRRFRVVDVVTREALAEDADLRATLEVLRGVRSVVDVRVSVADGQAPGSWRLLTLAEQQALWRHRGRG
jgi:hypothetical protein